MSHPIFQGIPNRPGLSGRVHRLELMAERLRNPLGMLDGRPALAKSVGELLDRAEEAFETAAASLSSAPKKHLDGPEAWESLASAVVAIARGEVITSGGKRGGLRVNAADLKELVVRYCAPQDRSSWHTSSPERIWGLLEHEGAESVIVGSHKRIGELRRLIDPQGVMFWFEWRDQHVRIVDARWLDSDEDAFRWVAEPWRGGRDCRFCGMTESPLIDALLPVELERRHGRTMVNDTVVLDAGASALTHDRCRNHWLRLLERIAPHRSVADAAAADAIAGRRSRFSGVQTSARRLAAPKEAKA